MRWLVIRTSLVSFPERPDFYIVDATDLDELTTKMGMYEHNMMNLTAVPLHLIQTFLKSLIPRASPKEGAKEIVEIFSSYGLYPEITSRLRSNDRNVRRELEEFLGTWKI